MRPPIAIATISGIRFKQRVVLSMLFLASLASTALSVGSTDFLKARIGMRVGGGECANMVSEALRVSGLEFFGLNPSNNGDFVWGTPVKKISFANGKWIDSNPNAKVQPGHVIQYFNANFAGIGLFQQHTSVVATVNASGMPTQVYQQNVGNDGDPAKRTVHLDSIDLTKLNGGWVTIYRPFPRMDAPGTYKFSIVNNAGTNQQVQLFSGQQLLSIISMSNANTTNSYTTQPVTGSNLPPTLRLGNGASIAITNAGGYEIFQNGATVGLRRLNP
jgi:hypothetical protein